jgi:uncharacterized membrane protein
MKNVDRGMTPFCYLSAVTVISVFLIALNALLGMRIPFTVSFLAGYVGSLLVFVIWHALLTKGWKRSLLMFSLSFVVAFSAEALGVNYGLVFGHYYYTPALGVSLFGVPFLAALAWEPIVYAAFCLSDLLSEKAIGMGRISNHKTLPIWGAIIGALATTAWDLMIDPIAVHQGWWTWVGGGPYVPYVANGVPIQNFLGWLGVAFVINLIYRKVADRMDEPKPSAALSLYGPLTLYSSLFLTAFGVSLTVLRRPEVGLIGVLAMGPFIIITLTNLPIFLLNLNQVSSSTKLEPKI